MRLHLQISKPHWAARMVVAIRGACSTMRVRSYPCPIALPSLLWVRCLSCVAARVRGWVSIFVARVTARLVSRLTHRTLEGWRALERTRLASGIITLVTWSYSIIVNVRRFSPCSGTINAQSLIIRLLPSILKIVLSLGEHAGIARFLSDRGAVLDVRVSEVPFIVAS